MLKNGTCFLGLTWIQVFNAMWGVMDDGLNLSNIYQVLMVIDNVTRTPLGHTIPLKNDT